MQISEDTWRDGEGRGGGQTETAEDLRKSGKGGSGQRRREERRVYEGRYDDFERSDDGDVKGPS